MVEHAYDLSVFEPLREMVQSLRIPVDSAAIAEAIAIRSMLDARITEATAAFDEAELWDADAATSMTAWRRRTACRIARPVAPRWWRVGWRVCR